MASASHSADSNGATPPSSMSYACATCTKRKVKCDKISPVCSTCQKSKLDCHYQTPLPRGRKRKLSGDLSEKVARYERLLQQHGIIPDDEGTQQPLRVPPQDGPLRQNGLDMISEGKLVARSGKSRYISSNLWRNLGADEAPEMSDEDDDENHADLTDGLSSDPLTGALLGQQQDLLGYHPSHTHALVLWDTYVTNVEPICKILHVPTVSEMVHRVSQQPAVASKAEECLTFALYHFAVYSMTEETCLQKFGQSQTTLLRIWHFATRQALINASFLKTTEMSTLQALTLYLVACRYHYDPNTYWILTGVANRISQRMGLHRDGQKLDLPPFEIQMRRRLWYQIIPMDGGASMMSGTGMGALPNSWDCEPPSNLDDNQMWPGMTEPPKEREGATEMIFCLVRATVGRIMMREGKAISAFTSSSTTTYDEIDAIIRNSEREIEEKYIRYCDIVNPLHLLAIGIGRSAILTMRLRVRLPKVRNKTATAEEQKDMLQIALKVLDTDTATGASSHPSLRKFQWHTKNFFIFGTWDSLVLVLTSLPRIDIFTAVETDAMWTRIEQLYTNHRELLESKRTLQVAVRQLTLKAWDANPPRLKSPEPGYIAELHTQQQTRAQNKARRSESNLLSPSATTNSTTPLDMFGSCAENAASLGDDNLGLGHDFDLDTADWVFWDKVIKDYQAQGA